MSEYLRSERIGSAVVLTLSREAKRNALHAPLWSALQAAGVALAQDPPRSVILTGAGSHFCAGMDLSPENALFGRLLPAIAERDKDALRAIILELKAVMNAIAAIPCPVIAAIEGVCAGSGLELALCADLRVASRAATFSLPETRVGLMADVGGTMRATRALGASRAAELLLTGGKIDAARAESFGLVTRLVEPGEALAEALRLAEAIAENAPIATRATLGVLRAVPGLSDEAAAEAETRAGLETLLGGECLEGGQAFMEKRKPRWS